MSNRSSVKNTHDRMCVCHVTISIKNEQRIKNSMQVWQSFNGKLWQRNYWAHIIRDEQSYDRVAEYIINNPAKWREDKLNRTDPDIH